MFCFELAANPCAKSLSRAPAVETSDQPSIQSAVWKISNQESSGTGFFIAPNKLMTNFHVVSSSSKLEDMICHKKAAPGH